MHGTARDGQPRSTIGSSDVSLRIGFDMDGVLADFSSAYYAVEDRLYGASAHSAKPGDPEDESNDPPAPEPAQAEPSERERARARRRRTDAVWRAIGDTPNFWLSLDPLDVHAIRRIHQLMLQHRWEVFFITQRPPTPGETVQRQTQRWLVKQGFELPSVLVIPESRGAAAGALKLDYHVDDSPKNCIDVVSESRAKPILIVDVVDQALKASAMRLGIATAASIGEALDMLEEATARHAQPGLLNRLAQFAGWR
jgi:phosphoglycolate phosphatase-like HAD superfamily hydrolase